jgi:NTE family protein
MVIQGGFGQELSRPKIGLVLSGGGAKGLAHIGVLKVIDSLGIQVDYIAGTSMGAVVGGLYASGYNAHQLDSIFSSIDIDALLQDYTPRESKSFYEKRNDEIYALTLPFNNFKLGEVILPKLKTRWAERFQTIEGKLSNISQNENSVELVSPKVSLDSTESSPLKSLLKSVLKSPPNSLLSSGDSVISARFISGSVFSWLKFPKSSSLFVSNKSSSLRL